jgi:peptidyl-prolyl cis-trans isomerase SurA
MTTRKIPLAALTCLVALLGYSASGRAEIIEQILVRVNGELFTKTDLETRQIEALRSMGQRLDANASLDDAQLRKMLDEVTPDLMVNVIDEMLLVQRGRELGYKLGDEQFTGILDGLKKDNKIENDEQFAEALKQEGLTLADLRRNIERRMLVSRVEQNEILGRIAVSEVEAKEYYDSHLSEFTTPQSVTLREVFVTIPEGATPAQDTAARDKANQVRQRASAGESFETLVNELSDAPSKANAGLIGPLNVADLSPELRKMIEAMKPGQTTDVLRSARGYQILRLETLTPPEVMPFDKAKEQISDRVFTDKRREEYVKFLDRLRTQAIIEWKNDEIKKAYELGLAEQKKQLKG